MVPLQCSTQTARSLEKDGSDLSGVEESAESLRKELVPRVPWPSHDAHSLGV